MKRWAGKVAVVTGASSGIGSEIAKAFVRNGMNVVGLSLRADKNKPEVILIVIRDYKISEVNSTSLFLYFFSKRKT